MKKKQNDKVGIIVALVLVILIAASAITLPLIISYNASEPNDLPGDGTIYLANAGNVLTTSGRATGIMINAGGSMRFDIVGDGGNYTIKIVPNTNATETFDFYAASGQMKSFYMQPDLTTGFNINKQPDYFVITAPASGVSGILSQAYKSEVTIIGEVPVVDLFAATVTFENGTVLVVEFAVWIRTTGVSMSESEVMLCK